MFSCSAPWGEDILFPPGHFHAIPRCCCPATQRHYAVKLISQIWRTPFQMPVCLQLCCCDRRRFGDFHILQTESRRLDLSAVFMGSPASQIDAAAAAPRLGPAWAHYLFLIFFFFVLVENSCSAHWDDGAPRPVCHEARLFVFASICQKIAPNQIPLFDVRRE